MLASQRYTTVDPGLVASIFAPEHSWYSRSDPCSPHHSGDLSSQHLRQAVFVRPGSITILEPDSHRPNACAKCICRILAALISSNYVDFTARYTFQSTDNIRGNVLLIVS